MAETLERARTRIEGMRGTPRAGLLWSLTTGFYPVAPAPRGPTRRPWPAAAATRPQADGTLSARSRRGTRDETKAYRFHIISAPAKPARPATDSRKALSLSLVAYF